MVNDLKNNSQQVFLEQLSLQHKHNFNKIVIYMQIHLVSASTSRITNPTIDTNMTQLVSVLRYRHIFYISTRGRLNPDIGTDTQYKYKQTQRAKLPTDDFQRPIFNDGTMFYDQKKTTFYQKLPNYSTFATFPDSWRWLSCGGSWVGVGVGGSRGGITATNTQQQPEKILKNRKSVKKEEGEGCRQS